MGVYVFTLVSGPIATDTTVGHNSSVQADGWGRMIYLDPSSRIVNISWEVQKSKKASSLDFTNPESSQSGRDALAAKPNTAFRS